MTQVAERIEQIKRGEIPSGYVKTKDGIFPADWSTKRMEDWVSLCERPIELKDEETYQLVTVRRAFGGVDSRGYYKGKDILVKTYFEVRKGDFVISKRQIAHGACGVVPDCLDHAVVSNEYNVFVPKDKTNIAMFYLMMQLHHYLRLFYLMSDGVHIEKLLFKTDDWLRRSLAMPPLQEQRKIAEILSTQDRVIVLHDQKIEQLRLLKKYCLKEMFPRRGSNIPEVRFPGFTYPWEQRKLGEICQVTMGQSPDGYTYSETPSDYILVQGNADLKDGWVFPRIWTTQKTKTAEAGDLIMSVRAPAGAMGKTSYSVVLGRGVAGIKGNEFIFQSLIKMDSDGYWKKLAAGSTFESINSDVINGAELVVPQDIAEQNRIGEYFASLDHLIAFHQRKYDEEKKKKKALMQLLLTGIVRVKE